MTNNEWIKLIESKNNEIIKVGLKAYQDALNNKHLRFIVEINKAGDVIYWYDIAGGNTFHSSVHDGDALELFEFCFQYYDFDITEDVIIKKSIESGYQREIENLRLEAEQLYISLEYIIRNNHKELLSVVEECEQDAIEYEMENAEEAILQRINAKKETLNG